MGNAVIIKHAGRAASEYLRYYFCLLNFGLVGVLFSVLSAALFPMLPQRARAQFGKQAISFLFRFFLTALKAFGLAKLELSALDALCSEPGIVIAPNHPCLLDAVFIIAHVPNVACIMKAPIWDNVVLGGGARLAGYIRNDSTMGMVRLSALELRKGRPLLVFPEGTRTRRTPVNEFKGGIALIAKRAGAPIQTVFIETDNPFLGKGWPLLRKPCFPLVYRARLGKRFTVEGDLKAFMRELHEYYRQELAGQAAGHPSPVLHPAAAPRPGGAA